MKKMIHIAAVPGLAVLLSACAGPGTQPGTLDDLGPGGLAAVVLKELRDDSGPGGLKSVVRQATQDALNQSDPDKPGGPTLLQKVLSQPADPDKPEGLTLLQKVLLDMADDEEDPFVRREFFEFNWQGADPDIHAEVKDRLEQIFRKKNTKRPARSPGLEVDRILIYDDSKETEKEIGVRYTVENLAGMTAEDRDLIKWIEGEIALIPGVGENRIKTPIRMDPGLSRVTIPTSNTRNYVLARGIAPSAPECTVDFTYQVVRTDDIERREVTLFIHNGKSDGGLPVKQEGPKYVFKWEKGDVDPKTGKCDTDKVPEKAHFVMAKLEATDGRPTVVHYYSVDLVSHRVDQWYEYTEGRPACPPTEGIWTTPEGKIARRALGALVEDCLPTR